METEDSLFGNIDAVFARPLYNVLSKTGKANYEHDAFTMEGTRDLVERGSQVIALGSHAHIFCTWLQFGDSIVRSSVKKKNCEGMSG